MSKKTRRAVLGNQIVHRMPKVSDINLGTEIVGNPVRPDNEEDMEPIQCINGHWTTCGDLDKDHHCSQCPIEVEKDERSKAEDEFEDALDYLERQKRVDDVYDDYRD